MPFVLIRLALLSPWSDRRIHFMSLPDVAGIDALLRELQTLVERCLREGSRVGYFGCLYTRVTVALRQAILNGGFSDGEAVARLDVAFARRYLTAVAQHRSGD